MDSIMFRAIFDGAELEAPKKIFVFYGDSLILPYTPNRKYN